MFKTRLFESFEHFKSFDETDSLNWVVFPPNVIIDAKLGYIWFLQLKVGPIQNLMPDKIRLVEFLLQRTQGKRQLLQLLQSKILPPTNPDLDLVGSVFDKLNENYRSFLDVEVQNQVSHDEWWHGYYYDSGNNMDITSLFTT